MLIISVNDSLFVTPQITDFYATLVATKATQSLKSGVNNGSKYPKSTSQQHVERSLVDNISTADHNELRLVVMQNIAC